MKNKTKEFDPTNEFDPILNNPYSVHNYNEVSERFILIQIYSKVKKIEKELDKLSEQK